MQLRILNGELEGQVLPLSGDPISVGRTDENHLILPDPSVSRQHVQIYAYDGNWFLRNLRPEKAVYVNNSLQSDIVPLQPGTVIQIGSTQLQFEPSAQDGAEEHMAPSLSAPSALFPILLGVGAGMLILALIFLIANQGDSTPPVAEGSNSSPTPLITETSMNEPGEGGVILTPTIPLTLTNVLSPTESPTVTVEPSPTAEITETPEPSPTPVPSPTPEPILVVEIGEPTRQLFSSELLDPSLLNEKNVIWDRDILWTVPVSFTNNMENNAIDRGQIGVGIFAILENNERRQIPSFLLPDTDFAIEPDETQTMTWQVVLPTDVPLDAWAVEYGTFKAQGFFEEVVP